MPSFSFLGDAWLQQFADALTPGAGDSGGGDDDDDSDEKDEFADEPEEPISRVTYTLHYISVTWKLFAALIPPAELAGGVPALLVSLLFLGIITFFVQEFAVLLGCITGVPDQVTAISFVALGTSLPDTFASQHACVSDDDADGSLTNITGARLRPVSLRCFVLFALVAWFAKAFVHVSRT